jgi:hypothetical protein
MTQRLAEMIKSVSIKLEAYPLLPSLVPETIYLNMTTGARILELSVLAPVACVTKPLWCSVCGGRVGYRTGGGQGRVLQRPERDLPAAGHGPVAALVGLPPHARALHARAVAHHLTVPPPSRAPQAIRESLTNTRLLTFRPQGTWRSPCGTRCTLASGSSPLTRRSCTPRPWPPARSPTPTDPSSSTTSDSAPTMVPSPLTLGTRTRTCRTHARHNLHDPRCIGLAE